MELGADEPHAARMARTPVGRSSIAEALRARNMQILSEAIPSLVKRGSARLSRFIASRPNGVAAFPSPKKLAARLSVTGAEASPQLGISFRRERSVIYQPCTLCNIHYAEPQKIGTCERQHKLHGRIAALKHPAQRFRGVPSCDGEGKAQYQHYCDNISKHVKAYAKNQ